MALVMTLVVRDEADIVDAQLAHHLNAGVDFVIATDHRSVDGTTEILESYERDGVLRLIRETGDLLDQAAWQTRMSRLAATEHRADWIISSDADEFWWPRKGSLGEVLRAVPAGYGVVRAYSQSFLPREGGGSFSERMTVRLASTAPINDPATPYRPVAKVAYRADPRLVVGWGGHHLSGLPLRTLRGWCPIDLLHFPVRSPEQIARKYWNKATAWKRNLRGDLARAKSVFEQGRPEAIYGRLVVDDRTVERGVTEGYLVEDTRLRDALRLLRGPGGYVRARPDLRDAEQHPVDFVQEAAHALDVALLDEADLVRAQRRADDLAARVVRLEGGRRRGPVRGR